MLTIAKRSTAQLDLSPYPYETMSQVSWKLHLGHRHAGHVSARSNRELRWQIIENERGEKVTISKPFYLRCSPSIENGPLSLVILCLLLLKYLSFLRLYNLLSCSADSLVNVILQQEIGIGFERRTQQNKTIVTFCPSFWHKLFSSAMNAKCICKFLW